MSSSHTIKCLLTEFMLGQTGKYWALGHGPESGRLQISDWREGRLSVSLSILCVPGMGKHAPVRINLRLICACFKSCQVVIQKPIKRCLKRVNL